MKNNSEVWVEQKKMRTGYTTGSCAAAAAKAAVCMLLSGEVIQQVRLMTPKGVELDLEVEQIQRRQHGVRCAVRKDSGDDPDVTNGIYVYAEVRKEPEPGIYLDGGEGIGRITKKGAGAAGRCRCDQSGAAADDFGGGKRTEHPVRVSGRFICDHFRSGGEKTCRQNIQSTTGDRKRDFHTRNERDR